MNGLALTAQQHTALVLLEVHIAQMGACAMALKQMGAHSLADAMTSAAGALQKSHETFVDETRRAVTIAAPGDMAKLVAAP